MEKKENWGSEDKEATAEAEEYMAGGVKEKRRSMLTPALSL